MKEAHKAISFDMKMDVLKRFERGEHLVDIARMLSLPTSTVMTIASNVTEIKSSALKSSSSSSQKLLHPHPHLHFVSIL